MYKRQPITVILAQSDYALDYVDTLEEAMESFEVINRQAKKMTSLITVSYTHLHSI